MKRPHRISAIVPIYNESASLPQSIEAIDGFLDEHFTDYELIIVESGSTDGSAELCRALLDRLPCVRVYHEGRRNGYGSAVLTGLGNATKDWMWPLVVDMPFDLCAIEAAAPFLDEGVTVLSYRSHDPRDWRRRVRSAVFNAAARLLLGVRVQHINSAFKVVPVRIARSLKLQSRGWLIDAELVMELTRRGCPYVEIPVALTDRTVGRSSIGLGAVLRSAVELVSLSCRRWVTGPR